MQRKIVTIISLLLCVAMTLGLAPLMGFAEGGSGDTISTQITIKPKDVIVEYSPIGTVYKPTEIEYVGDSAKLADGDIFTELEFSGEKQFAGEIETSIASYKIMRGETDVTALYTNIVTQNGKLSIFPFSPPVPSFKMGVDCGKIIPISEILDVLNKEPSDLGTPTLSGEGSFDKSIGYTAPAKSGTATLSFKEPAVDVNEDGLVEISEQTLEINITIYNVITVGKSGNYQTLQSAIDAATEYDKIKLLSNAAPISEAVTIAKDKKILIDLNGNTLYINDDKTEITNNGYLELMDSSTQLRGRVGDIINNGILLLNDVDINSVVNNENGDLEIQMGSLTSLTNLGNVFSEGCELGTLYNSGNFAMFTGSLEKYELKDDKAELNAIGGWYGFDVSKYDSTGAFVTRLKYEIKDQKPNGDPSVISFDKYATNNTSEDYEPYMQVLNYADSANVTAQLDIVKANANKEYIYIENFSNIILINNNTAFDVIINNHILAAGAKDKRLSDLPKEYMDSLFEISVINGTARVNGREGYRAVSGDAVSLGSNGAPEGMEFDRWEITGIDTGSLNLTQGVLEFTMPSNDIYAKAIYRNSTTAPTEPTEKPTEKPTDPIIDFVLGDVNGDGQVKANDARTALRAAAQLEKLDDKALKAADIDGNGKVTAAEARKILRFAAKLDKELK